MTRCGLLLTWEGNCSFILENLEGQVDVWTKVVTFYLQFFTVTKMKVCKEEPRRAFEVKTRNQCYWGSYEKGAEESKDTIISWKIRVSDKGDSLIKHRREQKSSHNLTGRHNGISRIKRKKKIFGLWFYRLCATSVPGLCWDVCFNFGWSWHIYSVLFSFWSAFFIRK